MIRIAFCLTVTNADAFFTGGQMTETATVHRYSDCVDFKDGDTEDPEDGDGPQIDCKKCREYLGLDPLTSSRKTATWLDS